ncbi:hypothetical protein GCM10027615_02850 [Plantactinospora veratri]
MGLRVDDDDLGLPRPELLRQAQGRVQADVTGTYHKDPLRIHASIFPPPGAGCWPDAPSVIDDAE